MLTSSFNCNLGGFSLKIPLTTIDGNVTCPNGSRYQKMHGEWELMFFAIFDVQGQAIALLRLVNLNPGYILIIIIIIIANI